MTAEGEAAGSFARLARTVERMVAALSRLAMICAVLLLAGIFAMIVYAVGMRYFAGQPQSWVDEMAGWLLVGSVMLSIPEAQRRGEHIGIDMAIRAAGPRLRRGLVALGVAMVLATALVFAREGYEMVAFSRMINVLSNQLPDVPLWMIQSFVPVGFGLMALVAASQLLCLAAGVKPRDMAEDAREEI